MNYTLLDNGLDSLKATSHSLEKFADAEDLAERPYHHIKDAILSINHANEILFKYLLKKEQEHLIYTDINLFMKAKEEMKANNLSNVMDTKVRLHTVSLHESINRLEFICDSEIPHSFKKLLLHLNTFRNKLMHYELVLNDENSGAMGFKIMKLYEETEDFFSEHISNFSLYLDCAREEITYEDYYGQYADHSYEAYREAQAD